MHFLCSPLRFTPPSGSHGTDTAQTHTSPRLCLGSQSPRLMPLVKKPGLLFANACNQTTCRLCPLLSSGPAYSQSSCFTFPSLKPHVTSMSLLPKIQREVGSANRVRVPPSLLLPEQLSSAPQHPTHCMCLESLQHPAQSRTPLLSARPADPQCSALACSSVAPHACISRLCQQHRRGSASTPKQ